MTTQATTLHTLYDMVQKRPRPEDVAEAILQLLEGQPILITNERLLLNRAAARSAKRLKWIESSMMPDFARPQSGIIKSMEIANKILNTAKDIPPGTISELDLEKVRDFVKQTSPCIARKAGDPFSARLPKKQRRALGMYKNARWYNKRWLLLQRIEKKIDQLEMNREKYLYTRISNSGLAFQIPEKELLSDLGTACFITYYSSRCSMRSQFTNSSQVQAFDDVSEALLKRCEASNTTRWDLIAMVAPFKNVVEHLTWEQKGKLLGRWWSWMTLMADGLHNIIKHQKFDPAKMIVSKGDDSSTWNAIAGAWNEARTQWISILYAMELQSMLHSLLPGKVMRLMAADVARWHRSSGGDVHPDTKVWASLPFPWEVVRGDKPCTLMMITEALISAGIVGSASWIGEKATPKAVAFTPTPELVHGVTVSSPELAIALKKAGAFSGKVLKHSPPPVNVIRDEHGAAVSVEALKKNEEERIPLHPRSWLR